jgi:hypothetical protein
MRAFSKLAALVALIVWGHSAYAGTPVPYAYTFVGNVVNQGSGV